VKCHRPSGFAAVASGPRTQRPRSPSLKRSDARYRVWFYREELRGGGTYDAWDQKIRQQIRDCGECLRQLFCYVGNVRLGSRQARKSFGSENLPFSINKTNQADSVCTSIARVPAQSRLGAARHVCTSLNPASSRAASQRASDQVVMRVPT
jgi:hypothetical protein